VTATSPPPPAFVGSPTGHSSAGHGFLAALDDRRLALAAVGPNWFASVMGTSIVVTAAVTLPVRVPGLRPLALGMWVLAGLLLVAVTAATAGHWIRHRERARAHLDNPVMAHFYGAPPMALLAFGAATLLAGSDILGVRTAFAVDVVLWLTGTALGLLTAVAVPYRLFTRLDVPPEGAFGGWLMPVVPPMSSATGALLVPHVPAGQLRQTLLLGCYAMFGLGLLASLMVITVLWNRLAQHKVDPSAMVPTLWIVLGPLGQSITAANNLGTQAALALPFDRDVGPGPGVGIGPVPRLGPALLHRAGRGLARRRRPNRCRDLIGPAAQGLSTESSAMAHQRTDTRWRGRTGGQTRSAGVRSGVISGGGGVTRRRGGGHAPRRHRGPSIRGRYRARGRLAVQARGPLR
jgi:tellurite resistance protein TehA-like permease